MCPLKKYGGDVNQLIYLLIPVVILFWLIALYNRLIALRQTRNNAFSDIDVQLTMRHDLVPNLVATVKQYAVHESGVFEKVTEARASAMKANSVSDKIGAENALDGALMKMMAISENYPELKANANFLKLQGDLTGIEQSIAASRRFFNNATAEYNTARQQFPASLVAGIAGCHEELFFDVPDEQKAAIAQAPAVSFN